MSIIEDFKAFISRGNVMDMAIGVIIGGAFGKIVTSLVNDIVMPGIGYLIGGLDFADMKYVMSPAVLDKAGEIVTPEVAICYGNFINTVIEFLIIAICIFLVITVIQKARAKFDALLKVQKEEVKEEPKVSDETKLLTEIRDLLKEKN
ncbi:MAG TPA: large-conductance mechanosensitive channel protein MscL [Saccharofermentans sp.]|nr:large-conductance mechanosensitive channel protein MscL [Saccharofermentans sp.]HPE27913.1 large-conductance mechanosensitive channel protein MscL [Saccharofermentans sp.]HPQ31518.1 large-conductance mechanosensitive channel protein MscL [Saccharofermentans sp.]HRV50477.1 large-conductance mechanosensitive channel protein MscL [Saccharofermentans sp.]